MLLLKQPAVAELMLVTQHYRVTVDPVIIVWRRRKVRITLKLLKRQPAWIAAIEATGIKIERPELMLVRSIPNVKIGLPQIKLAVVTLPIRAYVAPSRRSSNGPTASWITL